MQAADQRLKQRIRILKLISRVVAFIISLVTLVPLAMTVAKFLLTKDEQFTVNGQERTAWAADSITWYTFMYFGVSLISCLFNFAILVAYWRGVKQANNVASIASWWSHTVLVGHVLIWIVSAAIYRYGREPVDGKFRDLWGWYVQYRRTSQSRVEPNALTGHAALLPMRFSPKSRTSITVNIVRCR